VVVVLKDLPPKANEKPGQTRFVREGLGVDPERYRLLKEEAAQHARELRAKTPPEELPQPPKHSDAPNVGAPSSIQVPKPAYGARVVTVQRWLPGTRVLVTFLRNGVRPEARVAYCQRTETGGFAIGVELSGASRVGNLA
jgi:hypothetical protein